MVREGRSEGDRQFSDRSLFQYPVSSSMRSLSTLTVVSSITAT